MDKFPFVVTFCLVNECENCSVQYCQIGDISDNHSLRFSKLHLTPELHQSLETDLYQLAKCISQSNFLDCLGQRERDKKEKT